MARARATEHIRPRSKTAQIEEITRGIEQFHDILVSIEDFGREGFPYRDAARAKAELQLRECVRRIFGEKSSEFQTYRNHKLRTTNKDETAQSVAAVKSLIRTLEEKKLELQGLKPPAPEPSPITAPVATPQLALVPPTAQIIVPSQPVSHTPPTTVSVAMTTNLGTPATTHMAPIQPASVPPGPPSSHVPPIQPLPPVSPAVQVPTPYYVVAPPVVNPSQTVPAPSKTEIPPPDSISLTPQLSAPVFEHQASRATETGTTLPPAGQPTPAEVAAVKPTIQPVLPEGRLSGRAEEQDPMECIRKVCLRFYAVTRQLRLRKDYRATLEVEDEYDLQDLLCALLKVEFDEVGTDEWTPPYTDGASRTTFLIHREQIAVVAKKTRPGLTTKELADQVTADSARYANRDKCTTLFCFIYDPEGRIGSPKRLETDLTSVSDRYMIEVLVAPK